MRKLASVQVVNAVEPIAGADAIEKVGVLGWWVVAKKGEYKPGDKIVYCEIDSLLPVREEFEFLRKNCFKSGQGDVPDGFRIKTVRLRGQVSQGICFPLAVLPAGTSTEEDADVTEALGVRLWEPALAAVMTGKAKGGFPGFLSKTDEARVQTLRGVLERHRGKLFYATEKLDGSSFTAYLRAGEYGICSRNLRVDEDGDGVFAQVARDLDLREKLGRLAGIIGPDVAVQGEIIGPAIQKNKYKLAAPRLYLFTVTDLTAGVVLSPNASRNAAAYIGLDFVPYTGALTLDHTVDALVEFAAGTSALAAGVQREGVVLRPDVPERDHAVGGWLSFKVINPNFLLKYDE